MIAVNCIVKQVEGTANLRFAKMGHGEAIIFPIGNEYYLRDFGAYSPDRTADMPHCPITKLAEKILNSDRECCFLCGSGGRLNAILSHSHRDHFNGFKKLLEMKKDSIPIFSKAYLPCKCSNKKDWATYSTAVEANVIVYCLCSNDGVKENTENFLTADLLLSQIL